MQAKKNKANTAIKRRSRNRKDPVNVDRYIDDFQRILLLCEDGNQPSKICFYTGLGRKLVSEYIDFIKEHNLTHSGVDMLNIKLSKS